MTEGGTFTLWKDGKVVTSAQANTAPSSISETLFANDGTAHTFDKVTYTPAAGTKYKEGVDYEIKYYNNTRGELAAIYVNALGNGRVDISKNILTTNTDFHYVQKGTYYAYCHAWKRGADGKKVFGEWSKIYKFTVKATTPSTPKITKVTVKGNTVTVTYTKSSNATGYDVILGSAVKSVNGEKRPVDYGTLVKKNIKGNVVTATFKNVPAGKYYAGVHSFNKTSEDGKKVFSKWSNSKAVTVK